MSVIRKEILATFKKLHRVAQSVFYEDEYAINSARIKINEEFKKNKETEDGVKQLKLANDVVNELKTNIVQAKLQESSGAYRVRITKDTKKLDNVMYNDDIVIEHIDRKNRAKCGDAPKTE